jgi:hypothetical protein
LLLMLICALNIGGSVNQIVQGTQFGSLGNVLFGSWGIAMLLIIWYLGRNTLDLVSVESLLILPLLGLVPAVVVTIGFLAGNWIFVAVIFLVFGIVFTMIANVNDVTIVNVGYRIAMPFYVLIFLVIVGVVECLLGYLPTTLLYLWWNWLGTILFWLIWTTCLGFLLWYGSRQERRARNPLHGLLTEQGVGTIERHHRLLRFMRWLPLNRG